MARPRPKLRTASAVLVPIALLAACVLGAPGVALASNGARPISFGPKGAGRAGAETAVADDAVSLAVNPAGMAQIPGARTDIVLANLIARVRFTDDRQDELNTGYGPIPTVGIVFDPFGPPGPSAEGDPESGAAGAAAEAADGRGARDGIAPGTSGLRLGLQLFAPGGAIDETDFETELFPDGFESKTTLFAIAMAPTVSVRILDTLALGASFHFYVIQFDLKGLIGGTKSTFEGQVLVRNLGGEPVEPPVPPLPPPDDDLTFGELFDLAQTGDPISSTIVEFDTAYTYGFGGQVGLLWQPIPELSIGAAYTFEGFVADIEGDAEVDASKSIESLNSNPEVQAITGFLFNSFLPNGGTEGFKADYDYTIEEVALPAIFALGVALRPVDELLLAFDYKWIRWSDAFDVFKVTLEDGTNEDINEVNGGSTIERDVELEWDDQHVFAIGAAFLATDWLVLRTGYNYGNNPVPDSSLTPSNSGIIEHHVAIGAGVYVGAFDIDIGYIWGLPNKETISGNDSNPEYNGVEVNAEQHWIYVGLGVSF